MISAVVVGIFELFVARVVGIRVELMLVLVLVEPLWSFLVVSLSFSVVVVVVVGGFFGFHQVSEGSPLPLNLTLAAHHIHSFAFLGSTLSLLLLLLLPFGVSFGKCEVDGGGSKLVSAWWLFSIFLSLVEGLGVCVYVKI